MSKAKNYIIHNVLNGRWFSDELDAQYGNPSCGLNKQFYKELIDNDRSKKILLRFMAAMLPESRFRQPANGI